MVLEPIFKKILKNILIIILNYLKKTHGWCGFVVGQEFWAGVLSKSFGQEF
jgi:hypothetical protein